MLGMALVDRFVDAMVRPEMVMRAMQEGQMSPAAAKTSDAPRSPSSNPDSPAKAREDTKPKWTYDRKGMDKLIAYATDPKRPSAQNPEKLGVVFECSGFASWKLTQVRLPAVSRKPSVANTR
jgi:hypothetical protein